jgi:phosphoenolpyruvate-protein kinase (PTS system EI component)
VAETTTNRGKNEILSAILAKDMRVAVILGTQTGVNDPDLNTLAELDAVSGVSLHSERIALSSEAVTEDDANNRSGFDAANVSFAAAPGVTAQGVALYEEVGGSDSTRLLYATYTTGFPQPMDGGLNVTIADLLRLT